MNYITLADWRRDVAAMYGRIRGSDDPFLAYADFRITRDRLFTDHEQSPLDDEQRLSFSGLSYFSYDLQLRVIGEVIVEQVQESFVIDLPVEGSFRFKRFAKVHFALDGRPMSLALYWVEGYGGGLFLPFRDRSNGRSTYGGGRYLYDGIKGADLGTTGTTIMLDFNFSYNPSCAYNGRWVCPLAPPENWLDVEIKAGEKVFQEIRF